MSYTNVLPGFFTWQFVELGPVLSINLLQMYPHLVFPACLMATEVTPEGLFTKVHDSHMTLCLVLSAEHLKNFIKNT